MDEKKIKCPQCGCTEIGKGKFEGRAKLYPIDTFFSMGSEVVADVCTKCGYILGMKALECEKFK